MSSIFLDPTGAHLLVATENLELYYFLKSTKKFKQISKLKGFLVTSVGWNSNSTEATTDSILIGTKKGLLFEICINIGDESRIFNQTIDNLCKQVILKILIHFRFNKCVKLLRFMILARMLLFMEFKYFKSF